MTWLISKLTGWMALLGVILSAGIAIFLKGRSIGSATEKAKQQANELKAVQTAKEIQNEVDGLNDADLDKRYSKWVRK